jgi:hypothetical protein
MVGNAGCVDEGCGLPKTSREIESQQRGTGGGGIRLDTNSITLDMGMPAMKQLGRRRTCTGRLVFR